MVVNEIYEAWKPIRNFLRKANPKIALEVIRYYSLFSGNPNESPPNPPGYIEVNSQVLSRKPVGIFPWDMEVLAREVVLSSEEGERYYSNDLRQWRHFANLMEKLRHLENVISEVDIDPENVLLEMFRIGHRQFPHQQDAMSKTTIIRYGKLFAHPEVAPIVIDKTGLSYQKIATIGLMFWGQFQDYSSVEHSSSGMGHTNISKQDIEAFLAVYSKSFSEMKKLAKEVHVLDNTFLYQFSPLSAYPLIMFENDNAITYVCPSVNRFAVQITRGIYYMLYRDRRFDNAFGQAFESYVGELIEATLGNGDKYKLYPQETDTSRNKRRCDWIVEQGDEFVMVECKTKRMAISGYTVLDNRDALIEQLKIIADAVVQTYQGYLVYKNEGYNPKVYPYNPQKRAAICVVTLEKWYLYGEPAGELDKIVKAKLQELDIDISLVGEVPYEVIGVDDFEKLIFVAKRGESIRNIFESHSNGDESTHELFVYMNSLHENCLKEYDYVFSKELDLYITPGNDGDGVI